MINFIIPLFLLTTISGEEEPPILEAPQAAENEILLHYSEALEVPEACVFTPPTGYLAADPKTLPENIYAMVIGKGKGSFPPSINLGIIPYSGTLKGFIKKIKAENEAQNAQFKDLGQISTESGNAALVQVDIPTEWGDLRELHGIVVRYGSVYILTAAALKNEFSDFYKDFFQTIRSMKINQDVFEQVKSLDKRAKLLNEVAKLKNEWSKQKETEDLEQFLQPFLTFISKELNGMGETWKNYLIEKIRKDLKTD